MNPRDVDRACFLLADWRAFRVSGRDAVELLGRLSTNDLAPLLRGESVTTLFLSPTGRLLHRVLLQPDPGGSSLRAIVEAGAGAASTFPAWVEHYTFAEDARVEPADDLAALVVLGAAASSPPASGGGLWWSRRDLGSIPATIVSGPSAGIAGLAERLAPGDVLDAEAWLQIRVLEGVPVAGAEITEDYFPLEAGLVSDISFTKGCYTGQEVVARQDAYDKVTRRLVLLAFETAPSTGDVLASEAKEGCRITSVAPRPVDLDGRRRHVALGYVRSRNAGVGTEVQTASGLRGHVAKMGSGVIVSPR